MKIVLLSRYQKKYSRGVETFAKELSTRLSAHHQVEIFSGNESDNLLRVIKSRADIVIPLNGRLQALKVSIGRLLGRYKVLISGHSGIGRDDIWNIFIVRPNIFVALTQQGLKWARNWSFGVKTIQIPNGVDTNVFHPEGPIFNLNLPHPIILSVGSLVWYKHHERLIEATSKLKQGSVLIVGSGELEKDLNKLGHEKLPGRFNIIKVDYSKMPKIYRSVDLFSLPSWDREAFGIVYLEAMATNLAVVAPDDANRREIIKEAGILTNVLDPETYSKSLEEALSKKWGNKPRNQAMNFSWEKISRLYEEAMKDLINE